MRKLRFGLGLIVGIVGLLAAGASPAAAYGNGSAYQVGFSLNCVNLDACVASQNNPFGIGGIWGWIVVDNTGHVDGEAEFQGHQNADPNLNGTGHISFSGVAVPTTFRLPFVPADSTGNYLLILQCGSAGCFPAFEIEATGGHYAQNFGPGIDTEIQIAQLP